MRGSHIFTKGFSLVTNLRTYIGDDFNIVAGDPAHRLYSRLGNVLSALFAVRAGKTLRRGCGSLRREAGAARSVRWPAKPSAKPIRPLDSKNMSGNAFAANRITVNLRPIVHPAELPPITMMNWLVVLEERRKEFVGN